MPVWSIGFPEKERLEMSLSRESPADSEYEWLSARVKVAAGGFAGEMAMSILYAELLRFHEELKPVYHELRGKAELRTLEGQIHLIVTVDKTGHITVEGELMDGAGIGNRLCFEICFDQTGLWHTLSELDDALSEIREDKA